MSIFSLKQCPASVGFLLGLLFDPEDGGHGLPPSSARFLFSLLFNPEDGGYMFF
jgi:hypothetical protein